MARWGATFSSVVVAAGQWLGGTTLEVPADMFTTSSTETPTRFADIGESFAGLMHDFRGPMATIFGFAELMCTEEDPVARAAMFETIGRQVACLNQMSAQTLAFARGEQPLLLRKVPLYAFARSLEERLARQFCGTHVTPVVHAGYRGPAVIDEVQLLRAIDNLARNAAEAMTDGVGTRFVVTIEQQGEALVLTGADDGPGLPASVREHLFQPLTTVGKRGGTGLGLAIVKKVAEGHGGTVAWVAQEHGTCFEIRLPMAPAVGEVVSRKPCAKRVATAVAAAP